MASSHVSRVAVTGRACLMPMREKDATVSPACSLPSTVTTIRMRPRTAAGGKGRVESTSGSAMASASSIRSDGKRLRTEWEVGGMMG